MANKIQTTILRILFLTSIIFANQIRVSADKPLIKISKQKSAYNVSDELLKIFDLGQSRLFADILWISTLLESDMEHYKEKDLNSWLYLRFKTISSLDPKFRSNYQFGGQYLSIIKDDLTGAEDIFLRGLKVYPNDYFLNFYLGFLYIYELEDYEKGENYFFKIKDHPKAPKYLSSLLVKLKFEQTNDLSVAKAVLLEIYNNTTSETIKSKLFIELYAIQAQIDLECLNTMKKKCNKKDILGKKYILKGGRYESQKPFKKFGIHKRK